MLEKSITYNKALLPYIFSAALQIYPQSAALEMVRTLRTIFAISLPVGIGCLAILGAGCAWGCESNPYTNTLLIIGIGGILVAAITYLIGILNVIYKLIFK